MGGNIPHLPMFNIPETFGKALSYEGQIHAIFEMYDEQIEIFNAAIPALETALDSLDDIDASIELADTAATDANNAATSATQAATDANNAAASATQAATDANNAAASATQAATDANNAATSATQAATAATNAAASAIAASDNRLIGTLDGTDTSDTADDAWIGPILGATVDGLSTQDGTPTPNASVEIKSAEAAGAVVAGRNLADIEQGGFGTGGINQISYERVRSRNYIPVTPGSTVSFSVVHIGSKSMKIGISYYAVADYVTQRIASTGWLADTVHSNTVPTGAAWARLIVMTTDDTRFTPADVQIMFEYGATLHEYEPFGSETALLPSTAAPLRSLPDGTHDELSVARDGTVQVIRRVGAFTMNSVTWSMGANVGLFYHARTDMPGNDSSLVPMCEAYAGHAAVTNAGGANTALASGEIAVSYAASQPYIYIKDTSYSTAAEFNAATTDALVLYPLATPTTETLTPVTMPTVQSHNLTAWVYATDQDGAAMAAGWTVDYERDITIVIDQIEQAI